MPAYGLTGSGRFWYLASHQALTVNFGLVQSRYEPSLYHKRSAKKTLVLVVQVDDYLDTGTPALSQRFEELLAGQFHAGTFESKCFHIMGEKFVQHPSGYVTIDAKRKLNDLQPLYNERLHRKMATMMPRRST